MHSLFMPHGWCMTWNPWLIGLNVATDAAVTLSYYSIPLALVLIAWRRKLTLKLEPILLLFACFIALCGGGHFIDIISIWKPIYWTKGFWNLGTAVASVTTAIVLIPRTFEFLKMPERAQQLEREASELREQSTLLAAVIDAVEEAVLLVDATGHVLLRNRAAAEMLPETTVDPVFDVPGGRGIWTSPEGREIERFAADVPGYGRLLVFRDLTDRLRTEQARVRLERIISGMRQGFEVVSLPDGRIIQTNPSFDRMYGDPAMLGRPAESIFAGDAEQQRRVFQQIRDACERDAFWEGETRQATPSGAEFWCASRFNLHEESGNRFLSAIHQDITQQKQAAAESARVEARLREAAKLESLGLLAGGVAHDFNNLLVGILGNASLAMDTISSNSPAHGMLRDVVAASESAATLTRQLLAYAGKGRFLVEPIDLSDLVSQISTLVQTSIPKTVQLRLQLTPQLPCIEADASQIQQLIMNLVINGAEAVGEQSGNVLVTTGTQDVDEQYIRAVLTPEQISPGKYVVLEVHDNGSGMDEETVAKIFDPFFTTKFTGRGLGLAAVLGIVRAHRGALKVYSTPGHGTTFKVLFPATDQTRPPVAPKAIPALKRGVESILVVDDEAFVRLGAKSILERYGYTVYTAEHGKEGVDLFRVMGKKISAVILDMTMPVMSGAETFRELKRIDPETPVILSSGYNEVEAVQRFTGKGLAAFIQKPYSAASLVESVRRVLEEARDAGGESDSQAKL